MTPADYGPDTGGDPDAGDVQYCTSCGGSGEGDADGTSCVHCRGSGERLILPLSYWESVAEDLKFAHELDG